MTQAELTQKLTDFTVQLRKAVDEIIAAVGNQQNVSPELQAAAENLGALIQVADDLNADPTP